MALSNQPVRRRWIPWAVSGAVLAVLLGLGALWVRSLSSWFGGSNADPSAPETASAPAAPASPSAPGAPSTVTAQVQPQPQKVIPPWESTPQNTPDPGPGYIPAYKVHPPPPTYVPPPPPPMPPPNPAEHTPTLEELRTPHTEQK